MPAKARSAVLNARDSELGRTALHYAAKLGSHETIEQLLKAGCDVDMVTKTKHTPLRSAAAQGHTSAVAALISANAKVNIPDMKGVNPLHAAASIGNMDVVAALLQGRDSKQAVQACDHRGCTVLHYAISSGVRIPDCHCPACTLSWLHAHLCCMPTCCTMTLPTSSCKLDHAVSGFHAFMCDCKEYCIIICEDAAPRQLCVRETRLTPHLLAHLAMMSHVIFSCLFPII